MPSAPAVEATPEIDRFLRELAKAKVLDGHRVRIAWDTFLKSDPDPDIPGFADSLVQNGLLTPFQAGCAVLGDAGKLNLGPYLLQEPLGLPRFGTDYVALRRVDRRRFFVKVLPLRSLWKVLQAKQLPVRLQDSPLHQAIVPLADVDSADGSHYLSWPYVEGESLAELLSRQGPPAPGSVCRVFAEAAEGLAQCHAAGIVHGMLTPANFWLTPDGGLRILELGLGAIQIENLDDESMFDTISTAHSALDLMNYCAPETIADPAVRTQATDAYAFGCVLYTALTGRHPFPDGNAVDKMIAHQTQPAPSARAIRPAITAPLDELIQNLLKKAPYDRPGLREASETLQSLRIGLPVESPSTIAHGTVTLGVDQLADSFPTAPPAPKSAHSVSSDRNTANEGSIDFDVPVDRADTQTPASYRPPSGKKPIPVPTSPSVPLPSPKLFDNGASVPVLLLPEIAANKGLSTPNSSNGTPPGPKAPPESPSKRNWQPLPAPVIWSNGPSLREQQSVRPSVALPSLPQFHNSFARKLRKQFLFWQPHEDTVQLSIFGAPVMAPGQRVNLLVYAHTPEGSANVATLCRALRPESELLGAGFLEVPVRRGVDVGIHMALSHAGVAKSLVKFTWLGQTQPRTFEVFVPWESPAGLTSGVVTAGIDRTMVGSIPLHFVIPARQM